MKKRNDQHIQSNRFLRLCSLASLRETILRLFILLPLYFLLSTAGAQVQPPKYVDNTPVNSIKTWSPQIPLSDPVQVTQAGLSPRQVQLSTQYFDGLGRLIQTVVRQGSQATGQSALDMVSPTYYDQFGRESLNFLHYRSSTGDGTFKQDPFAEQRSFYQQQLAGQGETFYYGQTNYEPSPLNRVQKTMAPGNSWTGNGKGIENKYQINKAGDEVRIWEISTQQPALGSFSNYTTNRTYSAGQLYKNITIDEHGKQEIEFKDKEDKIILKKIQNIATPDDINGNNHDGWLCTYYLYDDLGDLRCIIQPVGVEMLAANGWQLSPTILDEQCFRYEYDHRNRMVMKKVPGAGEVYMVYDKRDRLVYTQDANMRNQNQWLVTLYDQLNRSVQTGLLTQAASLAGMQTQANNLSPAASQQTINGSLPGGEIESDLIVNNRQLGQSQYKATQSITVTEDFESEDGAEFTMEVDAGFQGTKIPFQTTQWVQGNPLPEGYPYLPITYTYYDNYDNLPAGITRNIETNGADLITSYNQAPDYAQEVKADYRTKGIVTWEQTRILGTDKFITTVNLYDDKGRIIQQKALNATGGLDIETTQYDWSGKELRTYYVQQKAGNSPQTITIATKNSYDDLGRLTQTEKNINNTGYKTVVQMEYDALGQLKKKTLGNGLETQDFDYNVRGWTTAMNKNYITDQQREHYFGYELGYDKSNTLIPQTSYLRPQYNGNISGQIWKSAGDTEKRKYDYQYDSVNRLTGADFNQYTNNSFNKTSGIDYSVSNLNYDANGNIKSMNQMGVKGVGSNMIDQLSYSYYPGSNKLQQVTDGANDYGSKLGDFKYNPATKTGQDYVYDLNGNLVQDNNKNIQSIVYNHLNLPQLITVKDKGTIEYVYDAAGSKIKKIVRENGQTPKITLYLGVAIYENDQLQFIGHEEGRARISLSQGEGRGEVIYDYYIKDHLGNIRMTLTEETKTDVYPVATLEPANLQTEKQLYDINEGNIVNKYSITGFTAASGSNYPNNNGIASGSTQNADGESQQVYRLYGNGTGETGLGITLKVMSGDQINIFGKSYYFQNNTTKDNYDLPLESILAGLLGGVGSVAGQTHTSVAELRANAGTTELIEALLSKQKSDNDPTLEKPRAYINYLLFDEQFKCVRTGSSPVGNAGEIKTHSELQNIPITKNGYVYVYCSNQAPLDVFFDNLQVVHTKGHIVSEDHYYPFGLAMAGVSSKATNSLENREKFGGKELQSNEFRDGSGLDLYDFQARYFNPQIGRWNHIDPLTDSMECFSPYNYVFNNPIRLIDPDGMAPGDPPERTEHFRQATADEWRERPDHALLLDAGYLLAEFLGLTAIDNAISTFSDPNSTTSEKVEAIVVTGFATGRGKTKTKVRVVEYKDGVNINLYGNKKWNAAQDAAAKGKAKGYTKAKMSTTSTPEARDPNLRRKYIQQGGKLKPGEDLDHKVDLQFKGTNAMKNLGGLNSSVNRSIGKQMQIATRNLPDNTRVYRVNYIPYKQLKK